MASKGILDTKAKYTVTLSVTEMGLGALLHSWRIPFTGHSLSLNQVYLMSRATKSLKKPDWRTGLQMGTVAAVLKSLAPIGKRLTPMLAISMQGALFSFGQFVLGAGLIGTILGALLASLWAFVQPLAIYYFIFGNTLVEVVQHYFNKLQKVFPITPDQLFITLLGLIACKATLAIIVATLGRSLSDQSHKKYLEKVETKNFVPLRPKQNEGNPVLVVLKDLLKPWFLISIGLISAFFVVTDQPTINMVYYLLRTFCLAFAIFYALRYLPLDRYLLKLFKKDTTIHSLLSKSLATIKASGSLPK